MDTFLQLSSSGFLLGGVYALLALSVVVIYKATKVFNFAVGSLSLLGAYLLWTAFMAMNIPLWISAPVVLAAASVFGVIVYQVAIRPMVGQPLISIVFMTLGLSIVIDALVIIIWGAEQRYYTEFIPLTGISLGKVVISEQYLVAFIVAILLFAVLTIFFQRTRTGLAMRAVAESHDASRATGIKVGNIFMWTWVIAAVSGAVAGILLGSIRGVDLTLSTVGLKAFPVVLLGGLESIPGCIIGGLIIGVAETLAAGYMDSFTQGGMSEVVPWALVLVVLFTTPYGLFGEGRIERI